MLVTSCVLGLWLLLVAQARPPKTGMNQDGTHEPRLLSRQKRFMMKSQFLWPNAVLPYVFEESIFPQKHEIERVMVFIEDMSCVRFPSSEKMDRRAYGLNHPANITFYKGDGCFSAVGFTKVGVRTSCCTGEACLHEIGHAMGFSHEQNSPLRAGWIDVNMDFIPEKMKSQYILTTSNEYNYSRPYDISTMMHYFPVEFIKGKPAYSKDFPELGIAEQYFYFFKELAEGYQCYDKPQCQGHSMTCENDGFLTVLHGTCQCYCPTGLDPTNGCRTPLTKGTTSSWPKGQYALPQPQTGCPSDGTFQDGYITNIGKDGNYRSHNYKLKGEVKDTKAELHFCARKAKDDVFNTKEGSKFNWPLGNYCVYMTGDRCPTGFDVRTIDHYGYSTQSTVGEIPSVTDSSIKMCCQYRGFPKEPASFPTDKPFALIQYPKEKCQQVTGMKYELQSISLTSTRPFKTDQLFTPWQFSNKNRITIPICYYRPADMNCGGMTVLSKSNPETIVSMSSNGRTDLECTWVVQGDTTDGTLVLDFDEFDVKKEGEKCVDKVEVRHAMIGQTGQEYCGEMKHSIRSITNKLMIRFFSNGNSQSSFKARIKWIPSDDMCYDVRDKGVSYDGDINYTRIFQPCLPWAEMTHCPHNPFVNDRTEHVDNLVGNACRNPDNSFRPWCYTDKAGCGRNYCDVCGLEKPHDQVDYCDELKKQRFCTKDPTQAVKLCAATCYDLFPNKPLQAKPCPDGYTLHDDQCFGLAKDLTIATYNEALEACRKEGGTVAAPRNQEEANIIKDIVKHQYAWIGMNDRATEGRWVYEDGTPLVWTNWDDVEPNNIGNEDAAVMKSTTKWMDVPWHYRYHFVCSVEKSKRGGVTCGQPTPPGDGTLLGTSKSKYSLGETVQYKCKHSKSVVTSRCMTSGLWSDHGSACLRCPPNYTLYKNTCIGRPKYASKDTYIGALAVCKKEGGTVAAPRSQEEADLILKITNNQNAWIGINDKQTEGRWVYEDGTDVVWTNWNKAEPNNIGNEDEVVMTSSSKWMDISWYYKYHYTCSFPALEPASCMDVLGKKCESLMVDRPTLCADFPDFGLSYCRKSCGSCHVTRGQCPVIPTDANVVLMSSPDGPAISVGESVKYACSRFQYRVSGDHERACLSNGRLAGEPLKCGDCPLGFKAYKDNCYGVLPGTHMTFWESQEQCKALRGFVAMPKTSVSNMVVNYIGLDQKVWLGITDTANENHFVWEDGSTLTWSSWASGEPDRSGGKDKDCVYMTENKQWINARCDSMKLLTVCTISKSDNDMCYDIDDGGASYDGTVSYTRSFQPCLPWTQVTHCPHHAFNSGDVWANLEGNMCRNPDKSYRPWCYTNADGCQRNYCDVCGNESPKDKRDDCAVFKNDDLCSRDSESAITDCAATCLPLFPNKSPVINYTEIHCGPPKPPTDGDLVGKSLSQYKVGQKVFFKCKKAEWRVSTTCLTSGQWSHVGYSCTECPEGFNLSGDKCYLALEGRHTYTDAVALCKEKDSSVAIPGSRGEALEITSLTKRVVWVGLSDEKSEGSWTSDDGGSAVWTNWNTGEPNGKRRENCILMNGDGGWVDVPCGYAFAVVCSVTKLESNVCADLLTDRCPRLLNEEYSMCQEHPEFSRHYCAKTCGFCHNGKVRDCPIETTEPFVEILTPTTTSIATGQYVKYSCTINTHPVNGDEARACLPNGQLTGEPLQCGDCPEGFKLVANACHGLIKGRLLTYEQAKGKCGELGGFPALPKTYPEKDYISSLGEGEKSVWMGVTKSDVRSNMTWEDGSDFNWGHWSNNDDSQGDCVAIDTMGQWVKLDCDNRETRTVCTLPLTAETKCDTNLFKGICYELLDHGNSLTYDDGVAACSAKRGMVSVPRSLLEARFLLNMTKGYTMWLGVTDKKTEGTWVDGEGNPPEWTNWNSMEPSNYNGEDCAAMMYGTGWMDVLCTYNYPIVCGVRHTDSPIKCSSPRSPYQDETTQGQFNTSYSVGDTVGYKCDRGPWTVVSRCMTNGHWSNTGHACLDCDGQYLNGKCYTVITTSKTHDEIVADCKGQGGSLAAPRNQEEASLVAAMAGAHQMSWVGITDKKTEGQWVYEKDGSDLVWTNWNTGEPNNYGTNGEDCAAMYDGTKWIDVPCNYAYRGVCTKELHLP